MKRGNYIADSITEIKAKVKENGDRTTIKIETTSGSVEPRLIRVLEIGDDYIVGRGRNKMLPEYFSFNHIASWRFAEYQPSEWKW